MNLSFYPTEWPALARGIKEACDWQCQACQRQCRRPGEFYLGWEYELTVAHYDHAYEEEVAFVVALCRACHFKHDARFVWVARRRWARLRALQAGQLELLAARN